MKYFFNFFEIIEQTYVFDNHNEERQFDAEGLLRIGGASDVVGGDVSAHDFKN